MDTIEAIRKVLREEGGGPLHWTVIQDFALQRGYIDPFSQTDIRKAVLAALAEGTKDGVLCKEGKGAYRLPAQLR